MKTWMLLAVLAVGCDRPAPKAAPPAARARVELMGNLPALASPGKAKFTVGGIGVGDDRAVIKPEDVVKNRLDGDTRYLDHKNGSTYAIVDGKVAWIEVDTEGNRALAESLGIKSDADIERVFGEASSAEPSGAGKRYKFSGFTLDWSDGGQYHKPTIREITITN